MSIRYKVTTYGGMRGLLFPDLVITYSSGYIIPLEVPEGEYLPLEILEPLDVKKSLIAGSLGKFIADGKVKVEGDKLSVIDLEKNPKPKLDSKIETPKPTKTEMVEELTKAPSPIVEPPKVIEQITNLSDVKKLEDFDRLSHYLKSRFLKETEDKALLLRIYETTKSESFKLNVKRRLKEI